MIGVGNCEGSYSDNDQEILEVLTPTILEVLLRKRAEIQLNESKMLAESQAKQMNVILDNINEAIVVADAGGNLITMNPAALKIHGFSSIEEFKNSKEYRSSLEVFSLDGKLVPIEEYAIKRALRGETYTDYELIAHRKDIDHKWIGSYGGTPIYDKNGNLSMVVITLRDITQTIQNQMEIKNQHEQLLKAEKEKNEALEKAIEMKDEFLSLISHEFRTPLNVINTAIQALYLLHADELSDKVKEYIATIKQNTFRQLRLVNNLLDITRANAGCIKIHKKNMDIVFLTREITGSVHQYASLKGVELSFVSTVKKKVIGIDDEKYERILLNLLSNAIKFTPEGNSILVMLRSMKDYVCIEVKDNGIGIQKDKLDIIFERFGQVDSSLSRQAEGTGIGLSLVKKFVEALDGNVSVKSRPGKGSTFTVRLPSVKVAEENNEKPITGLLDNRLEQVTNVEFSDIYL
jgi:PAS domain S-box-containing protein